MKNIDCILKLNGINNAKSISIVTQIYQTGVKLTQKAMAELDKQIKRLPGLDKWFVEISVSRI